MKEVVKKVKLLKPVNVDKITIGRDHYFPNAYVIDLPLDSIPDHVWMSIFEREWKSSRHVWDRKLFVMGDQLRLITTANDIKEKLEWIKQVIEHTNKGIDNYHRETQARVEQTGERLKKQVREEEAQAEMIRETVRKSLR
jgi:hypothetical protein